MSLACPVNELDDDSCIRFNYLRAASEIKKSSDDLPSSIHDHKHMHML